MKTYFAPPERLNKDEIQHELNVVSDHPIIDEIMNASGGLFAVMDEHRQIVAINESFLEKVGVDNAAEVLGLRLGEAVQCVHACELPGGCGTSSYCSTCGAVIATITALESEEAVESSCVITTEKDYKDLDLYFNVRCHALHIDGYRFLLLYLQDISIQQQWAYLEQSFLHDISNTLQGLIGTSELLLDESKVTKDRLVNIRKLSQALAQEISIQKALSTTLSHSYQPLYNDLTVHSILDELKRIFTNHPLVAERTLKIDYPDEIIEFVSDNALVTRVLVNMVTNALEATELQKEVTLKVESEGDTVVFCVWNPTCIPEDIAKRVFQRNFTTKDSLGHGLGTYSMKLFGEKILGGQVSFKSSEKDGTVFKFALQCN